MPFCYRCLLDWNEQIRVSHVQFKIPPVSGRGVTSGLPSWWYRHSAGHRVVPQISSSWLACSAGPSCLALSLKLRPFNSWCLVVTQHPYQT